jgi:hypothetical protein
MLNIRPPCSHQWHRWHKGLHPGAEEVSITIVANRRQLALVAVYWKSLAAQPGAIWGVQRNGKNGPQPSSQSTVTSHKPTWQCGTRRYRKNLLRLGAGTQPFSDSRPAAIYRCTTITLSGYTVKKTNKRTHLCSKEAFVVVCTDGVIMDCFAWWDDGCYHVMIFFFVFGCLATKLFFIPCKNSLQKHLPVMGGTSRMQEGAAQGNLVTVCTVTWHPACTKFSIFHLSWKISEHYPDKCVALGRCQPT